MAERELSTAERQAFVDIVAEVEEGSTPECDCAAMVSVQTAQAVWVTALQVCHEPAAWVSVWTEQNGQVHRSVACEGHKRAVEDGMRVYGADRRLVRSVDWLAL